MIGGTSAIIPPAPPPINGGNGQADIFEILPMVSGVDERYGFEDGLDMLDLTFLNQPGWHGAQGAANDGSVLFDFWNEGCKYQKESFTAVMLVFLALMLPAAVVVILPLASSPEHITKVPEVSAKP